MDISVRTVDYGVEDRSWLGSAHGTEATRTITLDIAAFDAATHYPNGYIPSGMVLTRNDTTGMYEPYSGSGAAGFLFNSISVQSDANVGAPLLEHGMIREDRLPENSGFDESAATDMAGRIVVRQEGTD